MREWGRVKFISIQLTSLIFLKPIFWQPLSGFSKINELFNIWDNIQNMSTAMQPAKIWLLPSVSSQNGSHYNPPMTTSTMNWVRKEVEIRKVSCHYQNFPQETFKYLLRIVKNFYLPFQLKGLKRGPTFTVDGIIDNFSRHDYDLILDCKWNTQPHLVW